jgi:hypothetical protein
MAVAGPCPVADADRMNGQRIGAFCGGAFIGQLAARALFDWILDVGGTVEILLIVGSALSVALLFLYAQIESDHEAATPDGSSATRAP